MSEGANMQESDTGPDGWEPALRSVIGQIPSYADGRDIGKAMDEIDALRARLATATELVRGLEWEGDEMGVKCPQCRKLYPSHSPDCRLAAFLEGCRNDNPKESK